MDATYWNGLGLLLRMRNLFFLILFIPVAVSAQLRFIPNQGQWPNEVKWMSEVPGGRVWQNQSGLRFELYNNDFFAQFHPDETTAKRQPRGHVFDLTWKNANPNMQWRGEKHFPFYHQYFLGNRKGQTLVYLTGSMLGVYDHIDVLWSSAVDKLKYNWVVHPQGNPKNIVCQWDKNVACSLKNGSLIIQTETGEIQENKPFAFQFIQGKIIPVECAFVLKNNAVGFHLGEYNPNEDLIIDPEIIFSSYIGSVAANFGFTAADDPEGHLVSGAVVFGQNYPTTPNAFSLNFNTTTGNIYDIAISKFSADGSTLLYSNFIGGSSQETPHSLVCDPNGNIYLMGATGSADFPAQPGGYDTQFNPGASQPMNTFFYGNLPQGTDLFIAKIESGGALVASTFMGNDQLDGLNFAPGLFYNYGDAFRGEINLHPNGNVVVATTVRGDFPVTINAIQSTYNGGTSDGLLMVLSPNLDNLIFSSFIGGSSNDALYAVQFAGNGDILVSGGTDSNNFPIPANGFDASHNGGVDGFVLKINPTTWSIVNGTFIGTDGVDQTFFIQTDVSHNIYVLGQTTGAMPITGGCYGQANSGIYIKKFNPQLSAQLWNTTIGTGSGEVDISPTAFLVSDCEQIFFSGWGGGVNQNCGGSPYSCMAVFSTTNGLPTSADAQQPTTDGSDFYLCVLSPNATGLLYASYYGGTASEEHVDGGTSRFSKNGYVYQAVCAGCQANDDFPTSPGAYSAINPSSGCNLGVFKLSLSPIYAAASPNIPPQVCLNEPVTFYNESTGASLYQWDFGDGNSSTLTEPVHAYTTPGIYEVELIASDAVLCLLGDTVTLEIEVIEDPAVSIAPISGICQGETVQLTATANGSVTWLPNLFLDDNTLASPTATPPGTITYTASTQNQCGTTSASIDVDVIPVNTDIVADQNICAGQTANLWASGGADYLWDNVTTLNAFDIANPIASPLTSTTYNVVITTVEGCVVNASTTVNVFNSLPGINPYPDVDVCLGESITLNAELADTWFWSPVELFDNGTIQNPVFTGDETTLVTLSMTNSCGSGYVNFWVNVVDVNVVLLANNSVCLGDTLLCTATGADLYTWQPTSWILQDNNNQALMVPFGSDSLRVMGANTLGCTDQQAQWIEVLPLPNLSLQDSITFDYPDAVSIPIVSNIPFGQWDPVHHLSCDTCAQTIADPTSPTLYHFSVADDAGCGAEDSIWVVPLYPFWVPNTFTPNQDGFNDGFGVVTLTPLNDFEFRIFDRWGALIFFSNDPLKKWDGSFRDYYVPQDAYIWELRFKLPEGDQLYRGHVTVLR